MMCCLSVRLFADKVCLFRALPSLSGQSVSVRPPDAPHLEGHGPLQKQGRLSQVIIYYIIILFFIIVIVA